MGFSASASSVPPRTGSATAASTSASATRASSASAVASRSRARRCAASAWVTWTWPRPSRTSGSSRACRAASATCSTWRPRSSRRSSTSPRRSSPGWTTRPARRTSASSRRRSTRRSSSYEAEREERVLELKEAVERRVKYLETGDQKGFADDDLLWADTLDVNLKKLSDDERAKMEKEIRKQFDADISDTEAYYEDGIERLQPDVGALPDDGAEAGDRGRDALPRAEGPLRIAVRLGRVLPRRHGCRVGARPAPAGRPRRRARGARGPGQDGQGPEAVARGQAPEGRLGLHPLGQQARGHGPRGRARDPAGAAPDGAARRWPLRDVRPERPLPPRHQPEQPAEAAARPRRARDHRQQREADASGGRRRAVRQRPPRPARDRAGQPSAQVAQRHAEGQAGPLPPEPAR